MKQLDTDISMANARQVDVFSPSNFDSAQKHRKSARDRRSQSQDQKKILHSLAVSRAYLEKANEITRVEIEVLPGVYDTRISALAANAKSQVPKELANADRSLKKVTGNIENGSTKLAGTKVLELVKRYRDLELSAILEEKMGPAIKNVKSAEDEGASKLTPKALASTKSQIAQLIAAIKQSPQDKLRVNAASVNSLASSQKLLDLVRGAKGSKGLTPEELAVREEASAQATEDLATDLGESETRLSQASDRNQQMESEVGLEEKYASV